MERLKRFSPDLPEYILIAAVVFYWTSSRAAINPVAIGLIIALILQLIFRSRIVGFLISGLLIITSLYMLMALLSEFNEFPTFNSDAKKLLFVGLSYFISTITVSVIMIYKYAAIETKNSHLTVSDNNFREN